MDQSTPQFHVNLTFEKAQLPPFSDILVLGRKSPVGMSGISKSLEFLLPNHFDLIPVDDPVVEGIVINGSITKRVPIEKVLKVLAARVFPFMSETEMIRVDFSVRVTHTDLMID